VGKEIVQSLLHNKVLGFHTQEYADNFLVTVQKILPGATVDLGNQTVSYRNISTKVVAMPLGIDFQYWQRISKASRVEAEAIPVKYRLAPQVLLGIDRLDYTKELLKNSKASSIF
jgi:trehalose 6-phosphate synthase